VDSSLAGPQDPLRTNSETLPNKGFGRNRPKPQHADPGRVLWRMGSRRITDSHFEAVMVAGDAVAMQPTPTPPPAPPAIPFVPTPDPPYRRRPKVIQQYGRVANEYARCLAAGHKRIALMADPGVRKPRSHEDFLTHYDTMVQRNDDSPTQSALVTVWRHQPSEYANHKYKNTPVPSQGILWSWENSRWIKDGKAYDPFSNADIYFHQYLLTHRKESGPDAPLPKLKKLERQQVRGADTEDVLDYLRWDRDIADNPAGTFGPASDAYAAFLGTVNGSAAAFLVIQYGDKLGISKITSIELMANQNLVFLFE
jgi:hypothetical protein